MGNHVHLLLVPDKEDGLAKTLGRTHTDYSRWLNVKRGETGHVWQSRYFSCPLDEGHQWEALRYVELNPVRAELSEAATDWRWSSASAHCGGHDESGLLDCQPNEIREDISRAMPTRESACLIAFEWAAPPR